MSGKRKLPPFAESARKARASKRPWACEQAYEEFAKHEDGPPAQGIEAQRAATGSTDAVACDESPVANGDAPKGEGQ